MAQERGGEVLAAAAVVGVNSELSVLVTSLELVAVVRVGEVESLTPRISEQVSGALIISVSFSASTCSSVISATFSGSFLEGDGAEDAALSSGS